MLNFTKWLGALLVAALVTGCGGSSDAGTPPFGGGGGGGGGGDVPTAADISLALSSTNISNSGTETVTVDVTAVDASRVALAGIPVSLAVDGSAVLVVGATATNAQGKVSASVSIGTDRSNRIVTVRATSGSLVRTASFQVTGAKLVATAIPAVLAPSAQGQVQYRLTDVNSNPIVNATVAVTGGGLTPGEGKTGVNGEYVFSYTAPAQAGTIDLTANAAGVAVTTAVVVQSGSGSIPNVPLGSVLSSTVTANPSVVSVNTASTNNRSEVRALFLGSANAPIKNVRVRFDLGGDPNSIGGTISTGSTVVYSDVNGIAAAAYVPASRSSPTDGVIVRACWGYSDSDLANGACPNAANTRLTVISEALSVTLGFNNLIEVGASGLTYVQRFVVLVVDSSGQAKPDVQITPSIDLLRFRKGYYGLVEKKWAAFFNASCDNEDLNRNGVLEVALEDANGSGSLEPRKSDVAISLVGSAKTDASGIATLKIEYPQNVASWVDYKILVSAAGVVGTEGRTSYSGTLAIPISALESNAEPPFARSPYGLETSPTVARVGPNGATVNLCTNPN
jgi:hypothetical protein